MSESQDYRARVAIIGGATAGAEAADKLATAGALCVVFEQNDRPYGKVEDGLPMWHKGLRHKEYAAIDGKLSRDDVHFVPRTTIGEHVGFKSLLDEWGFDLVVLAHGAWRDRTLPVEGADAYVGKGLVYQNPFIYWFNHYREAGYDGPQYQVHDGTAVIGGGLASIDVAKVIQLELTLAKLAERGIDHDIIEMEVEGIPAALEEHGLTFDDLGIEGCTLYYRRRLEDMPLVELPKNAKPEQVAKIEKLRRRVLDKAQKKFLFNVKPLHAPIGVVAEGDRMAGLRFAATEIDENGRAAIIEGQETEVRAPMFISSIGSIPAPMEGLPMKGELLDLEDWDNGKVMNYDDVFGCGNVVTGKGNLVASRKHAMQVTKHVQDKLEFRCDGSKADAVDALLSKVKGRQAEIGYTDYDSWIKKVPAS